MTMTLTSGALLAGMISSGRAASEVTAASAPPTAPAPESRSPGPRLRLLSRI
jgi:hypothetical protein